MPLGDTLAIVANDGGLAPGSVLADGLRLRDHVPQGHKVAMVDITAGAPVRHRHRRRAAAHLGRQLVQLHPV
jgi:hypothetical protein